MDEIGKGPPWNTYEENLPSHIWLDPMGMTEEFGKDGVLEGTPICKEKGPSFNCKFVPYQRLRDAEAKIKEYADIKKRLYEALNMAQEASNLKTSLEFYANQENWRYSDANNTNGVCIKNRISRDDCSEYSNENSSGGKRAREDLKRIEGEGK